jgi:hypothetical protein
MVIAPSSVLKSLMWCVLDWQILLASSFTAPLFYQDIQVFALGAYYLWSGREASDHIATQKDTIGD